MNWGRSFAALGIKYNGGRLQLDLLDRKGKYNNGFCHYQDVVYYKNGKWKPGSADFTCNAVPGQVGSGVRGLETLFHEGAHAADRLNGRQKEAILNTEYPPASVAWAETHSQFCDTIANSIEWRMRYAKNASGKAYPFELFEKKVRKLQPFQPLSMMGIIFVSEFEKEIYETANLTRQKTLKIAKKLDKKYFDLTVGSYHALYIPHIYSWDSSAYYHGYGLSELALHQWREYFYKKYGYIVDNPNIGREMTRVWRLGSTKTFPEFVKLATGKKLSTEAFIKTVTRSAEETLKTAKERIKRLETIPRYGKKVDLNAKIKMVHGKKTICTDAKSFEEMATNYAGWLKTSI
jgi:Zn-dependent oligopeptidase